MSTQEVKEAAHYATRLSQNQIGALYKLYQADELDPERFIDQMAAWLGYWTQNDPHHQIAYEFLTEVAAKIDRGGFGPSFSFGRTIQREFITFCRACHPDNLIESKDNYVDAYAAAKRTERRDALTRAYVRFLEDHGTESELFLSLKTYVLPKVGWAMHEFPEVAKDADDFCQLTLIKIFKSLHGFRGGPDKFTSWVNKFVYRACADAFNHAEAMDKEKVELVSDHPDEDGKPQTEQNPIIREQYLFRHGIGPDPMRLLTWIEEGSVDHRICLKLLEGLKLREIAEYLGMTQAAIKKRIQRIRDERKRRYAKAFADQKAAVKEPRSGQPYTDYLQEYQTALLWVRPTGKYQEMANA